MIGMHKITRRRWIGMIQSSILLIFLTVGWLLIRFYWVDGRQQFSVAEFAGHVVALLAGVQICLLFTKVDDRHDG